MHENPEEPLVWLRWEKSTRYYEVHLHPDLWGKWVLTRVWGRRNSRLGQIRNRGCESYAEGLRQLATVRTRRERRGYALVKEIL